MGYFMKLYLIFSACMLSSVMLFPAKDQEKYTLQSKATTPPQFNRNISCSKEGNVITVHGEADITVFTHNRAGLINQQAHITSGLDIETLAVSPDGDYMCVGSEDGIIRIFGTHSGALVKELDIHDKSAVKQFSFFPEQNHTRDFYSLSAGLLHLNRYTLTPNITHSLQSHILQAVYFPKVLVPIIINYLGDWKQKRTPIKIDQRFDHAAFSSDQTTLVLAQKKIISLLSLKKGNINPRQKSAKSMYVEGDGSIDAIAVSPNGQYIAAGLNNGDVCQWTVTPEMRSSKFVHDIPESACARIAGEQSNNFTNFITGLTYRYSPVPEVMAARSGIVSLCDFNTKAVQHVAKVPCFIRASATTSQGTIIVLTAQNEICIYANSTKK